MSEYEEGFDEDELDLVRDDDDEIDTTHDPHDPGRTRLGGEATAVATFGPLGGEEVQDIVETVPPHGRALLADVIRLHQILGDSQPIVADLAADIEAGLRLLYLELSKAPTTIFMAILSGLSPKEQAKEISKLEKTLVQRKFYLQNLENDQEAIS